MTIVYASDLLNQIADDSIAMKKRPRTEDMDDYADDDLALSPCKKKEETWINGSTLNAHMLGIVGDWFDLKRRRGDYSISIFSLYGEFKYNSVAQAEAIKLVTEIKTGKPFKVIEYNMDHNPSETQKMSVIGTLGVALLHNPKKYVTSTDIMKMIEFVKAAGLKIGVCVINQDKIIEDCATPLPLRINYHRLGITGFVDAATQIAEDEEVSEIDSELTVAPESSIENSETLAESLDDFDLSIVPGEIDAKLIKDLEEWVQIDSDDFIDISTPKDEPLAEECDDIPSVMDELLSEFFGDADIPTDALPADLKSEITALYADDTKEDESGDINALSEDYEI